MEEARAAGVTKMITIGVDLETLPQTQAIAEQFDGVFFTAGIHPHEAQVTSEREYITSLREYAKHPKCRGIGEAGLDYYYKHSPPEVQKEVFVQQSNLAVETGLPMIVHTRDAEDDQLVLLQNFVQAWRARWTDRSPGVIHCFTGTKEFGQKCLDLGFYISLSGILTFKTAEPLREAARSYPLERLLVETDSPYLAPVPKRGKKCEPSMVVHTAQFLADLKGVSLETLAQATSHNAQTLFRF